jgi:hypothetical protein
MIDRHRTHVTRPRDVARFEEAAATGLTSARPATPPPIDGRQTARQAFIWLVVTMGVSVVASILWLFVLAPQDETITAITFIATMAVGYVVTHTSLRRFRTIFLDELQAGYATKTLTQRLFWLPRSASGRPTWGDDVVGWDWAGLWVLDAEGNVVSAPDASADPPGLYPSPNIPGHRELWTGCRWTSVFLER